MNYKVIDDEMERLATVDPYFQSWRVEYKSHRGGNDQDRITKLLAIQLYGRIQALEKLVTAQAMNAMSLPQTFAINAQPVDG